MDAPARTWHPPARYPRRCPPVDVGTMGRPGVGLTMILMLIISSNGNNNCQGPTIQLDTSLTTLGLYTPGEATIIPSVSPQQQQLTMNKLQHNFKGSNYSHQQTTHDTRSKLGGNLSTIGIECDIGSPPSHLKDTSMATNAPDQHLQPQAATIVQKAATLQQGEATAPNIDHHIANAPIFNKPKGKDSQAKYMQHEQVEYHYEDQTIKAYLPQHNRVHASPQKLDKSDTWSPPSQSSEVQQHRVTSPQVQRQEGTSPVVAIMDRHTAPEEAMQPHTQAEPTPARGPSRVPAVNTWSPRSLVLLPTHGKRLLMQLSIKTTKGCNATILSSSATYSETALYLY